MFRLALHQVFKKERRQMMTSQERCLKNNKVIWTSNSRIIQVRISIPKQYQMIMSSVARVKFIKTKVIFRYHTKAVSNQVSSYSDHEIKSYSCSNSSTKVGKNEKKGNFFLDYKTGQWGNYKSALERLQIEAALGISNQGKEITNRGKGYKSVQSNFD